jgi:hypothetical protein
VWLVAAAVLLGAILISRCRNERLDNAARGGG